MIRQPRKARPGKTEIALLAKLRAGETVTAYYEHDLHWSIGYRVFSAAQALVRKRQASVVCETHKHSPDSRGRYRTVRSLQIVLA